MSFFWPLVILARSARTLHFISAFLLVLFVVIHVVMVMVIVPGLWNNLRSMLSGRYAITDEGAAR
jgi:thiosulfate reductase cytochrome b subunit